MILELEGGYGLSLLRIIISYEGNSYYITGKEVMFAGEEEWERKFEFETICKNGLPFLPPEIAEAILDRNGKYSLFFRKVIDCIYSFSPDENIAIFLEKVKSLPEEKRMKYAQEMCDTYDPDCFYKYI